MDQERFRLLMELTNRITSHFEQSARLQLEAGELLAPAIAAAAEIIVAALLNENKILACGNGGSASLAQYFAACMLNRFELERPGLAAIALPADNSTLTSIANDSHFDQIFSRQVLALGQSGDVLLALSMSGNSPNVLNAVQAAHEREISVIAFTGVDGGALLELLGTCDIHIGVPHENAARIQEAYIVALHCLCDAVDCLLLGVE